MKNNSLEISYGRRVWSRIQADEVYKTELICSTPLPRAKVAAVTNGASFADGVDVSVTGTPEASDLDAVQAGLAGFNARVAGMDKAAPLAVFARREGTLVGGATGFTHWKWLFIRHLWVSDELRGEGLGAHLLGTAEATARQRGCGAVWLDTFSFQAPGFYERLGYRQFGQLDDFPPGHARHFLWKPLG